MSLDLDPRQRAMLAEMGVPVWWPDGATPEAQSAPPVLQGQDDQAAQAVPLRTEHEDVQDLSHLAPAFDTLPETQAAATWAAPTVDGLSPVRAAAVARKPAPSSLLPLPEGVAAMPWPELASSVANCQGCTMCLGRMTPVLAPLDVSPRADWLVLGEPPDDAQELAGEPFVGDAGRLLDNMLKAVGVQRLRPGAVDQADPAHSAYLSLVLKCRPAVPAAPDAQAVAACANYLQREIALVKPKVILAMGRLAMRVLLSQEQPSGLNLPLAKLRGRVWHYQGVPVVVTYPPEYLLRSGQDKARTWQDLCLAQDVVQGLLT